MLFLDSELSGDYWEGQGHTVIVRFAAVFNPPDHWVLCLSQGSVSCIVMVSWITSMCVRMEPVAPAGTKHQHISVGHL